MLINVSQGEECRIALLEDGRLSEIYMERESNASHVGNIYMGKVTNVEAGIQAAFVDFGMGRNGFLHISDLLPTYFGGKNDDYQESVGRKLGRRDRPPIQRCLRRGDTVMVQIIKEGISTKGPTLSTYLSIPGRILVMMPGMENFGVSRKIEDDKERRRLRKILDELNPVEGVGFIVRTAGMGKSKAEIEKDLKYLTGLWDTIQEISREHRAPVELYTEGDLITRTVRDIYGADIDRIIIDDEEVAKKIEDFVKPSARSRTVVEFYDEPVPLFHAYGVEREIENINSRHVPLPSGGSLVIDSTEAVVAIDVNSGKFREHADAETTAFKTDMEAADEIPRQLKLRDLGGVIICDFIDLRYERHRRELEERLFNNFKKDKAKTRVLRMSEFGIIEITRQRQRASLKRSIYSDCPHCKGAGLVKTPESMAIDVMRKLALAVNDPRVVRAEVRVAAEVALFLNNQRRRALADLEEDAGKPVQILAEPNIGLDGVRWDLFDERDGKVVLDALGIGGGDREERPGERPTRGGRRRGRDRDRSAPAGDRARPQTSGRGRDGGRDSEEEDEASIPARPPERQRAFDAVKPAGLEQQRAGDGHRGPKVVAVPEAPADEFDDRDAEGFDGEGSDEVTDRYPAERGEGDGREEAGTDEGAASSTGPSDRGGEAPPADGDAARRRRRRRRGGRGRRRNRQLDENGNPIPVQLGPDGRPLDRSGDRAPGDGDSAERASVDRAGEDDPFSERGPDTLNEDEGDLIDRPLTARSGRDDEEDPDDLAGDGPSTARSSSRTADGDDDDNFAPTPSPRRDSRDDRADRGDMGAAPAAIGDDLDLSESDDDDTDAHSTDDEGSLSDVLREARDDARDEDAAALLPAATNPGELSPVDDADEDDGEDDGPAPEALTEDEALPRSRSSRSGRSRRGDRASARTPAAEPEPAEPEEPEPAGEKPAAEKPKPRRASRAAKPAPEKKPVKSSRAAPAKPSRADPKPAPKVRAAVAEKRVPPQPATPPAVDIVRTGSADKHLVPDEPIDPQPPRRPRSYRDLDEIPDDFD
jgi:ribonuclease E